MAGAYCQFCDHRCFVYRVIPAIPGVRSQQGLHLATCQRGMEHDRQETGGYDHTNTVNPMAEDDSPGHPFAAILAGTVNNRRRVDDGGDITEYLAAKAEGTGMRGWS